MISIRKYLLERPGAAAPTSAPSNAALWAFSSSVLDSISQHVLPGVENEAWRQQVEKLREALRPDWIEEDAAVGEASVDRILAGHRSEAQQASVKQALEIQNLLAILNQALIAMSDGRDRSVARLNNLQQSLQRTSMLQDIVALKSSLTDTIRFVREESAAESQASNQAMSHFEKDLARARELAGSSRIQLAGRQEAVARLQELVQGVPPGQAVYAVGYQLDRLPAIAERYGAEIAEELLAKVIRERLQPVAPVTEIYRWGQHGLVACFARRSDLTLLRNEVTNLNRSPIVHRVGVGTRTAVLTLSPSSLVGEAEPGSAEQLVHQVDRFAEVRG